VISSTKNIVKITFDSKSYKDMSDMNDDFRIEWIVGGCGGVLNKLKGEFSSPEYPEYYSFSTTCEWNIIVDNGFIIEITIEDLWFEAAGSCLFDYIAVC